MICINCEEDKSQWHFYKGRNACKLCVNIQNRKSYHKNKKLVKKEIVDKYKYNNLDLYFEEGWRERIDAFMREAIVELNAVYIKTRKYK